MGLIQLLAVNFLLPSTTKIYPKALNFDNWKRKEKPKELEFPVVERAQHYIKRYENPYYFSLRVLHFPQICT